MKKILKASFLSGMMLAAASGTTMSQSLGNQTTDPSNVMMVLDGSNSMWGQIDGTAKISIAKDVMTDLINTWDPKAPLGMVVYGHRRKNDCDDIEVVSMPGVVDRKSLINKVQSISPKGKTPISTSLNIGVAMSGGMFSGKKIDLILVSDGLETCGADPCATAQNIKQFNTNFKAHIIGFDVDDVEFKQLQCIATKTGGGFYRANNAQELQDALAKTVAAVSGDSTGNSGNGAGNDSSGAGNDSNPQQGEIEPATFLYGKLCEACERLEPIDVNWNVYKDGKQHHQGSGIIYPNDTHQFEPGEYQVAARFRNSQAVATGKIKIGADGKQIDALDLNAGSITAFSYVNEEDEEAAKTALYHFYPIVDGQVSDKETTIAYTNQSKSTETWLNAGKYKVTVSMGGNVSGAVEVDLAAGDQIEQLFDLRSGVIQPEVFLSGNIKHEKGFSHIKFFEVETGKTIEVGRHGNSQTVKPGRYEVEINLQPGLGSTKKRFPVNVNPGDMITGPFILDVAPFVVSFTSKTNGTKVHSATLLKENNDKSGFVKAGFALFAAFNKTQNDGLGAPGIYKLDINLTNGDKITSEPFEIVLGENRIINIDIP